MPRRNAVTVRWVRPPSDLQRAIQRYGDKVYQAIAAVARLIAQRMENEMRENAPWTDRTGLARSALFSTVNQEASLDLVVIYVSHGSAVEYGKFLELARGGRYAIILPTIERNIPEINRLLKEIFR